MIKQYKRARLSRKSDQVFSNKTLIKTAYLNVDGLGDVTLTSVTDTVSRKLPDLLFLVETKRREGETGLDISLPGYSSPIEAKRSEGARDGGGIVAFTKNTEGIIYKPHRPNINHPDDAFVAAERLWITCVSSKFKSAFCGLYLGFQSGDDKYGSQNDAILRVVQEEALDLRRKGYRVIFLGDFNAHIGCELGTGVPGNNDDINRNGLRLLNFLDMTDSVHINGACRIPGRLDTQIAKGLWTWQRSGKKSVIDYALISKEHLHSVHSMLIDDQGHFSSNSDHNWIFLEITDQFTIQKSNTNSKVIKEKWDIKPDQDWSTYKHDILEMIHDIDFSNIESLASSVSSVIIRALHSSIGLKIVGKNRPKPLPPELVTEFKKLRQCEKNWKTINSSQSNTDSVTQAEARYLEQKSKTHDMFFTYRCDIRSKVIESCKGNSTQARRNFWSHVSPNKKQSTDILAVMSPTSGMVKCNQKDIASEVESHLINVFNGSLVKLDCDKVESDSPMLDHCYSTPLSKSTSGQPDDHPYSCNPSKSLPKFDSSQTVEMDPKGFLDSCFTSDEIIETIKSLKNGKAKGWDSIPNEALKNLPSKMIDIITVLFNEIKSSGYLPTNWNRGRVTLVHKYGPREILGNYRPITVLISLCGLYSKLLNARLMQVVEHHNLLGEIQNGFRANRSAADNNFILGSTRWKAKAKRSKIHAAYIDISKAYDSVNRGILWKKLTALGIRGNFLATLKSLYSDDCIDCNVNGIVTRPIFLRRGLRQGCSLSPVLFALYISQVGTDIFLSNLGFSLGNVCISGLLFADDLVLIARSAIGLKSLLKLVKKGFDALKLTINCDKSKVISPEDHDWIIGDENTGEYLTLEKVSMYKYLGIWTYSTIFKTCSEKQKTCIKTAYN